MTKQHSLCYLAMFQAFSYKAKGMKTDYQEEQTEMLYSTYASSPKLGWVSY